MSEKLLSLIHNESPFEDFSHWDEFASVVGGVAFDFNLLVGVVHQLADVVVVVVEEPLGEGKVVVPLILPVGAGRVDETHEPRVIFNQSLVAFYIHKKKIPLAELVPPEAFEGCHRHLFVVVGVDELCHNVFPLTALLY